MLCVLRVGRCCFVARCFFPRCLLCCGFVVLFVAVRCLVVFVVGFCVVGCRLFLCLLFVLLVACWLACGGSYFVFGVCCLTLLVWCLLVGDCCLLFGCVWRVGWIALCVGWCVLFVVCG